MSSAALERLGAAQAILRAALESNDIETLEQAMTGVHDAVTEMRATGAWRERPDLRDDLVLALRNADSLRGHINALADRNRARLDRLVALSGAPRAQAYGRNGRLG